MSRSLSVQRSVPPRPLALNEHHLPTGTLIVAEVKRDVNGKLYLASWASYELVAAVSCLISPQEGDRVRAIIDRKTLYVTDILERKNSDPLVVHCAQRELYIQAESLKLSAERELALNAESITLRARVTHWISQRMQQMTRYWYLQADDVWRKIRYNDRLVAKNIDQHAEQSMNIKGNLTSVSGTALVKVDGSQIHMG